MNKFINRRKIEACDECGEILYGNDAVLQHRCDDIVILSDEESASQPPKKKIAQDKIKKNSKVKVPQNMDLKEEESLILAVQSRRPLWDPSTTPEERSPENIAKLWEEISKTTNDGHLDANQCRAKFKLFKDSYRKIIQHEVLPSGSAAPKKQSKWRFYDILSFLKDSCLMKRTASNNPDLRERHILEVEDSTPKKNKKDLSEVIDKITEAICAPLNITLPATPSPPDEIDGFLVVIGCKMRMMTASARDEFMIMMMEEATKRKSTLEQH